MRILIGVVLSLFHLFEDNCFRLFDWLNWLDRSRWTDDLNVRACDHRRLRTDVVLSLSWTRLLDRLHILNILNILHQNWLLLGDGLADWCPTADRLSLHWSWLFDRLLLLCWLLDQSWHWTPDTLAYHSAWLFDRLLLLHWFLNNLLLLGKSVWRFANHFHNWLLLLSSFLDQSWHWSSSDRLDWPLARQLDWLLFLWLFLNQSLHWFLGTLG